MPSVDWTEVYPPASVTTVARKRYINEPHSTSRVRNANCFSLITAYERNKAGILYTKGQYYVDCSKKTSRNTEDYMLILNNKVLEDIEENSNLNKVRIKKSNSVE